MKVVYLAEAEQELIDALEYLTTTSSSREIGEAFLNDLDETEARVIEYPYAQPIAGKQTRRCIFKRFPYQLIYTIAADEIRILAVAHLKRRPGYWR
ncbi:MAG: type II toxin-antitoxin system RelE/ParE family toxin [Alphaproteobacteria bacterium]|nr:type II toxin-antitoxin system RelE/ParE family toxin [Alphaproteobacteria bacterium]